MNATKPTPRDLHRSFSQTCKVFQEKIELIGKTGGKATLDVYFLWLKYADECRGADQSALLWEFVRWYRKDLNVNPEQLDV